MTDVWESEAKRIQKALAQYANQAPIDLKIQRDLLAILGQSHTHVASIGSDECALCCHDLRHRVHVRADAKSAPELSKLTAVRHYGRNTEHADEDGCWVTNEWIAGTLAGRGFCGATFEEAAQQLIDYLDAHIGHDSMVGQAVRDANWTHGPRVRLNENALCFQDNEAEASA